MAFNNSKYHLRFYCDYHRIEDFYEDSDSVRARKAVGDHNADSWHPKGVVGAKVERIKK